MAELPANSSFDIASSLNSDNATVVNAAPTRLRQISGYNAGAAGAWLKLYDETTLPVAADTPKKRLYLPPSSGFVFDMDFYFAAGLGLRIVTGAADNDATATAAGAILGLNVDYR